jgi:hypothetical protein
MQIAPNAKYATWFFSHAPTADWPEDIAIGEGVFAARNLGIRVADHWEKWLGSLVVEEVSAGGIALYVTSASRSPEVLDGENEELKKRANDLLYGLTIQGIPIHQRLLGMTGSHIRGEMQIRQYYGGKEIEPTYGIEFVPGRAEAEKAFRIASRLSQMQGAKGANWQRLLRVTRVLLDANRTGNSHGERFHQLVRVLDGLVKTRQGRGAADFGHRVQTFAVASHETWAALIEIYGVRGAVEHVNSALESMDPPAEVPDAKIHQYRIDRLNQLTRQVDVLVRFALIQIFESEGLFNLFRTEEGIDAFWSMRDGERVATWGNRVDIRGVA